MNEANPVILREIEKLGFSKVDKFRLLGLKINNKLDNADAIYGGITAKIRNLILFWERFKLTLPGCITIIKNLSNLSVKLHRLLPASSGRRASTIAEIN